MKSVGVGLVGLLGFAIVGCGDDTSGTGGSGGSGGGASTTSATTAAGTGGSTTAATGSGGGGAGSGADVVAFDVATQVPAGAEIQLCKYVTMPSDRGDMAAQRATHHYSDGSHHFLVYRTNLTALPEDGDTLRPCDESNWMSEVRGVAYAAQQPDGELALPDGVAQRFAPGEVLLVQTHYLNPGGDALDANIHVEFEMIDPETAPVEAGVFFFFNPIIHVPPLASAQATLACPVPEDVDLVFASSHMHARGTGYSAHLQGQPEGSLYTTETWEEPVPRAFSPGDPAAHVPAGSFLEYTCDFVNPTDATFRAGPSAADDEMCMFIGMYYPRLDPETELCWAGLAETQGTTSCLDTVDCAKACSDDACVATCLDQVCPNGAIPLMRLFQCTGPSCAEECAGDDADACQACALAECTDEVLACQAATCT